MTDTLYAHASGAKLTFDGSALVATDELGKAVFLPIRAHELQSLGITMMEADDPGFASEYAGAKLGADLVHELYQLRGCPQAETFRVLHANLCALMKLENADRAAGGFAVQVVNVLELGMANLPLMEEEGD